MKNTATAVMASTCQGMSFGEGQGSTFRVTLPVAAVGDVAVSQGPAPDAHAA